MNSNLIRREKSVGLGKIKCPFGQVREFRVPFHSPWFIGLKGREKTESEG